MQTSDYPVQLADDVTLNVRHVRQTTSIGVTLILLHEALGNVTLWKTLPEQLAQATGADVLVYDRRGYGQSTPEILPRPDDYLEQESVVWLPKLIETLALRKVILLGHSDGGSIALIAASARPDLVVGIITIAAHVFADPLTLQGIRAMVTRYQSTDLADRLARYHGARTAPLFEAWSQTWLRASFQASFDLSRWLPGIRCPALIVQGEQDEYGLPEQVTAIVEGIGPHGQACFLSGAGHAPQFQQPAIVLGLIAEFVASIIRESQ